MEGTNADKPVKYCLEYGEPIGASREDKKYCSSECRTAYNNERRKQAQPGTPSDPLAIVTEQAQFKKIYRILLHNREILFWHNEYLGDQLLLRDLLGRGFNPKYFTSVFTDENGFQHHCCFDYGYYVGSADKVYIIYRPEEI